MAGEPGPWELMRGLEKIEKRLDDFAKGFVPIALHNLLVEDVKELKLDLVEERAAREKADDANRQTTEEQRKARAQTWASIGLAGVAVVFSIFGSFIRDGLGLP